VETAQPVMCLGYVFFLKKRYNTKWLLYSCLCLGAFPPYLPKLNLPKPYTLNRAHVEIHVTVPTALEEVHVRSLVLALVPAPPDVGLGTGTNSELYSLQWIYIVKILGR
jgi:hypothetical protein